MAQRTKTDKIFDNKFNETQPEFDSHISFKPENEETGDLEDQVHYQMLFSDVDKIIRESKKFAHLIELDSDGKVQKLTKVQMNELYVYVINNLSIQYRKMEVFDIITDYFDIFPAKFYNALSNVFKDELLEELNRAKNIYVKKKISRLF
jgi:hypothetical protein